YDEWEYRLDGFQCKRNKPPSTSHSDTCPLPLSDSVSPTAGGDMDKVTKGSSKEKERERDAAEESAEEIEEVQTEIRDSDLPYLSSGLPAYLWDERFDTLQDMLTRIRHVSNCSFVRRSRTAKRSPLECTGCRECSVRYSDKKGFHLLGFNCPTHAPNCSVALPHPHMPRAMESVTGIPASLFSEQFPSMGALLDRLDMETGGQWMGCGL
ncbi:hypothetical protein KIPB_011805, partial [Kipferlia bialata]